MKTFSKIDVDLENTLKRLLEVLSERERKVITRRFSLDNKPRLTLEKIGRNFSVTRERVRQIEKDALKKLKRNAQNSKLKKISDFIINILKENGGIASEEKIVKQILKLVHQDSPVNSHIVQLSLFITPNIKKSESPKVFRKFWFLQDLIKLDNIKKVTKNAYLIAKTKSDVFLGQDIAKEVHKKINFSGKSLEQIISCIEVDFRFCYVGNEKFGLQEWRHINPKSIKDKALIILRKIKKPLHFIEIANAISNADFDKKVVTTQAVHNDLIRSTDFVLVGRGIYGLREWGYKHGTVADVIAEFLKNGGAKTKKEIVDYVKKQRNVKVGTISLALQKEDAFVRVGRAVYEFNQKNWNPTFGRGRKKFKKLESEQN